MCREDETPCTRQVTTKSKGLVQQRSGLRRIKRVRTNDTLPPLAPNFYFGVATAHLDHSHYHLFSHRNGSNSATTSTPMVPPSVPIFGSVHKFTALVSCSTHGPISSVVSLQAGPDMEPAVLSNLMTTFASGPRSAGSAHTRQEIHTRGISDLLEAATVHAYCKGRRHTLQRAGTYMACITFARSPPGTIVDGW